MIKAEGLKVSKIGGGQRSEWNAEMHFRTTCTIELEYILNGLPWQSFAFSE